MAKAVIVYASMTGNTEEIANFVKDELESNGVSVEIMECSNTTATEAYADADVCIAASYTYGEGELPDEIVDFYEELKELNLQGKLYGVVGSGDTSYGEFFGAAVNTLESAFEHTGAIKGSESVKIEFNIDGEEDEEKLKEFTSNIVQKFS